MFLVVTIPRLMRGGLALLGCRGSLLLLLELRLDCVRLLFKSGHQGLKYSTELLFNHGLGEVHLILHNSRARSLGGLVLQPNASDSLLTDFAAVA